MTITELAETIKTVVNFGGVLSFDATKPDGTPRKLIDVSKINAQGWHHKISLEKGLKSTYEWYRENFD